MKTTHANSTPQVLIRRPRPNVYGIEKIAKRTPKGFKYTNEIKLGRFGKISIPARAPKRK